MPDLIKKVKFVDFSVFYFLLFMFLVGCTESNEAEKDGNLGKPDIPAERLEKLSGNSVQIDPTVLYTLNITPDDLVKDLKKANIKSVHFFVVKFWDGSKDDRIIKEEYLHALQNNGIHVWLMMLGNCFYEKTALPEEWEMGLLSPYPGVYFYTFHHDDFVQWQVDRTERVLRNYNFDGIEFAESYFPEWETVDRNGFYGDVGVYAREKFSKNYLGWNDKIIEFSEIRRHTDYYKKWQDFRADAITNFNLKIKNAVKKTNPDVLFASWGMGIRGGTLAQIREHFGLDMLQIAKEVSPDVFFVQTAAQDWGDATLEYHYIREYDYVIKNINWSNSKVAVGVQTDIVSLSYGNQSKPKRTPEWWLNFMDLSLQIGYTTNTAYEYSFAKKEDIWLKDFINTVCTIYKEPSLSSEIIAKEIPLGLIKSEKDWHYIYSQSGLGWVNIKIE
ncbi:MAG: hypothetical protein AB2L24_29005 [Mangrovibacterium sp.]